MLNAIDLEALKQLIEAQPHGYLNATTDADPDKATPLPDKSGVVEPDSATVGVDGKPMPAVSSGALPASTSYTSSTSKITPGESSTVPFSDVQKAMDAVNNVKAPTFNTPRPSGPSPVVQAYLQRMMQKEVPDPEMQARMRQADFRNATAPLGAGIRNYLSAAYQMAGMNPPEAAPQGDPYAPVKAYIEAKKAQGQDKDSDLKSLDQLSQVEQRESIADKNRDAMDPNGIGNMDRVAKLKNAEQKIQLRLAEIMERERTGTLTREMQREGFQLREASNAVHAELAKAAQMNADTRSQSLDAALGNQVVQGAESQTVYRKDAPQIDQQIGSAVALKNKIRELRALEDNHRLGLLGAGEAAAQAKALIGEMPNLVNAAQTTHILAGPRVGTIRDAFADPRKADSLIKDLLSGGKYAKANLDELESIIENTLRAQATAKGVTLPKDLSALKVGNTKVKSAHPNRPGSGTGLGEEPAPDKVDVPSSLLQMPPPPAGKQRVYNPKTKQSALGPKGSKPPEGWVLMDVK